MATPNIVKISDRPHPTFKKHPYKSLEVDPLGAFSSVPHGVLHTEDIRVYIHANFEDFGESKLMDIYHKQLIDDSFEIKPQYKAIRDKHFAQCIHFPYFEEDEWVRYVLSRVHDNFLWLNKPFKITKDAIRAITGLHSSGGLPVLKSVKNQTVSDATRSKFDKRAMTVEDITEPDVKFASMIIGYKIYHSSRENSVPGTAIYTAYQMLKENADYDLCELLVNQLFENLQIKKDKKNSFKYGNLILCLFFYYMNELPRSSGWIWQNDRPVAIQIRDYLHGLGDAKARKIALWGYFKNFQSMMHARERIPQSLVEKYRDTVCFMVETDQCLMEAVEPRTVWIMPMGYEVDEQIVELHVQHMLSQPKDPKAERFGTFEELSIKIHVELKELEIKRKVRKEVEHIAQGLGIPKEALDVNWEKRRKAEEEKKEAEKKSKKSTLVETSTRTKSSKGSTPVTTKGSKISKLEGQTSGKGEKRSKIKATRAYTSQKDA